MWRVLFILTVLTANCEPYSKKHKATPNRNQRIIKVQGPPHYNSFYGHQKPVRKRPFGGHHHHHGDEYIRPNHPPPVPPFFNGPSTNHMKHLPRPPPHVFHKSPSYGLGFPYKSVSSHRPAIGKDHFRMQAITAVPARPSTGTSAGSSSVSTSTTYHSPAYTSSSSASIVSTSSQLHLISPPVTHIISADDNNGPIREIPAPNLAPKSHDASFGTIRVVADIGGIGGIGGIDGSGGLGGIKIHGVGDVGGILHGVSDIGGGIHHGIGDVSVMGGIDGVGIQDVEGIHGVNVPGDDGLSGVASVGGVSHLQAEEYGSLPTVRKNPSGVALEAIGKDQGLEVNTYIKESSDVGHGKGPTVEIANFDEGSSIDVTNLIKDAAGTSDHHSGYEVTEHHNHLPSNDQIIKGQDGSKLYYAPDPDPSLPVHKVPPTNDPHSTPSNGHKINNVYIPQISHGFQYLQGGSVGGHLSSQELFHLMHGYPAVIPQPVVAFVRQPQASGVILSGGGQNYYQNNYGSSQEGTDINQYLQLPEIHNLLHNSPESHHDQETIGGSQSSVMSQSVYSPENQYQGFSQAHYQSKARTSDSRLETNGGNFPTTDITHNYQYEPEASETDNRHSLTVIRQTNEGTLNSETVKELLLEDSAANELNQREQEGTTKILQLKNIPEVPFYATLPSKKAAEALASLQAAGSVASNYINKIKVMRGNQNSEDEHAQGRRIRLEDGVKSVDGETARPGSEKTIVDIQKSLPVYEKSIAAKNLVESDVEEITESESESTEEQKEDELENFEFKEEITNEAFGKRIRPK